MWGTWPLAQNIEFCTEPIYDEIEPQMEDGITQEAIFVLNGQPSFVTLEGDFISSTVYYAMDEFVRPECIIDA